MVVALFTPEFITVSGDGRITIPQHYCERISWIGGEQTLRIWLLLLASGRSRVLSDPEIERDPKLREVRSIIIGGPTHPDATATEFEPNQRAAFIGRLVPSNLSPPGPSWRLSLPKQVVPKEQKTVVLLFSLGYLEIWSLDTYHAALADPWPSDPM